MDKRGKDVSPEITIENEKNILKNLGLEYEIKNIFSGVDTYSNQIIARFKEFPGLDVATSYGKGINQKYSEASGFSELIENIANMMIFMYRIPTKLIKNGDFYVSSKEKLLSFDEVINLNGFVKSYIDGYGKEIIKPHFDLSCLYAGGEKAICVPIKDLLTEKTYYVPLFMTLNDSNGMCAGNTKEEALCQGIFELFERYSHDTIIKLRINPPIIDKKYFKGTKCEEIIKNIENFNGGNRYKVMVKDCSLNTGIPIVCVIVFDKWLKRYRTNFGASYSYEIALERCLTELLQNTTMDKLETLELVTIDEIDVSENIVKMMTESDATLPDEFLLSINHDYNFNGWINIGSDNKEILENIKKILIDKKINIYYFDNSFLGINCYKLLSYELMAYEILNVGDFYSEKLAIYYDLDSYKLTEDKAADKLNKLMNTDNYYGSPQHIIGIRNTKEFKNSDMGTVVDLIISVLNLKIGDIENFIYFADKFIYKYYGENKDGIELFKCLVDLHKLYIKEVDINIAINILEHVYKEEHIKESLAVFGNPDKIIELFGFFNEDGKGKMNFCVPDFKRRFDKFICEINRMRIESGK